MANQSSPVSNRLAVHTAKPSAVLFKHRNTRFSANCKGVYHAGLIRRMLHTSLSNCAEMSSPAMANNINTAPIAG
jgi:hypothetical protein